MDEKSSFLTTPVAILLGAFVIAVAILLQGGIIKLGKPPTTTQPATQPAGPKTEADIVKNLKTIASKLNLDQNKFNSCLDSGSKAALVTADLNDGAKVGVQGTPAFFINGRLLSGAQPYDQFKKIIDEELGGTASPSAEVRGGVSVGVGNLPALGSENAPVTIVEFSDYQCPFCEKHFIQAEPQLKSGYIDTGKVKFYYRDFPLSQIHQGAQKAAEAARCAGEQNKYWQYHDLVFQNQATIF